MSLPHKLSSISKYLQERTLHHCTHHLYTITTLNHIISVGEPHLSLPFSSNMKVLTFSESSTLHIYPEDSHYEQTKSYSADDKKNFLKDALKETIRISHMLDHCTNNPSTSDLEALGIENEEIIGIEHYLFNSPKRAGKRRKLHTSAIVTESKRSNDIHMLAKMSTVLAQRPKSLARQRAARAA